MGSREHMHWGKLRINEFYGFFPNFSNRHHQGASTKLSFRLLRHGATFLHQAGFIGMKQQ
jgi:hypothetical protein